MTITATGLGARVKEALYQRLDALTLSPALPVAYFDDLEFQKPSDNKYVEARIFTAPPIDLHVGANSEPVQYEGFLQLTLIWPEGDGEIPPAEKLDLLCNWFKRGTRLSCGGTVTLEVFRTPTLLSPIKEEPRVRYPVTIYYRVFG